MSHLLLIAILAYPFATSTQSPPAIAGFDWVKTITLDGRIDIAEFSSFDIDAVGRMAMTDNILRKAYLFHADGRCIGLPHDAFIAPSTMAAAPGNTWIALY